MLSGTAPTDDALFVTLVDALHYQSEDFPLSIIDKQELLDGQRTQKKPQEIFSLFSKRTRMLKALLATAALATLVPETTSMRHDGNPLSQFSRYSSHGRGLRPDPTLNIDQSRRRRKLCSFLL
jgi:hypothetical protein